MLIIGAKGFAKEVLEILHQKCATQDLCFYDDINKNISDKLYGLFPVIKTAAHAQRYFESINPHFALGIGHPQLRFKLYQKFASLGGELNSTISITAEIGTFGVYIGAGCNILGGVKISNDVTIGRGSLIYYNSIVTHDVTIGQFCEISPDVKLLGRCMIGDRVSIGAGAVIFPDVKIGNNSIIAAGSIVRNDVPANVMVAGMPAEIKKNL